jgi:hypothetical protein
MGKERVKRGSAERSGHALYRSRIFKMKIDGEGGDIDG